MASLSSLSFVFLFVFLLLSDFSLPIQSQKTQITRRHAVLLDQDDDTPPIPKPRSKKKTLDYAEGEEQKSVLKPKLKKKTLIDDAEEEEEEEEKPIPKLKLKKKTLIDDEVGEEKQPISKPKSKKKTLADVDDQPLAKPNSKKKTSMAEEEEEEEEQPIPIPKAKLKKKALIDPQSREEEKPIPNPTIKKKTLAFDSKNQTKSIKLKKSNSTSTTLNPSSSPKSKLNKTLTLKPTNSTKIPKPTSKTLNSSKLTKPSKLDSPITPKPTPKKSKSANSDPNPESIWTELSGSDSDLISEFRELPTQIHQALLPDLKKISVTSKAYIFKANKNIADNVKPFVGKQYASKIALAASVVFLILPLFLVTALVYRLNSYLSLQRFLIFVQAYLGIYFFTLALTAVVTGLEPLRFFYATSPSAYAWTQAVQTLGYLLYLLVQLIHLVVVFSAGENKIVVRALGLAQMIVGLAVGCHYYTSVFHRAVTGEPPRANWRVHGIYAGCFLAICLFARAERRKKAYDGGEDGKKS